MGEDRRGRENGVRALVLRGDRNTHGNDFEGAFKPESNRLVKFLETLGHDVDLVELDVSKEMPARLDQYCEIVSARRFDYCAQLGHGWIDGLQLGPHRKDAVRVAESFNAAMTDSGRLIVALYACSTGGTDHAGAPGGDGGLADVLRDECNRHGLSARFDAHETKGHTTENPRVRRMDATDYHGGFGGDWLVEPGTKPFDVWKHRLVNSDLRFLFPLLERGQLAYDLAGSS